MNYTVLTGRTQGVRMEQQFFAFFNQLFSPKVCLLWLLLGMGLPTFGQTSEVDLDDLEHEIFIPSGTFQTGDTVVIIVRLGTTSIPVNDVLGVELELELGTDVVPLGEEHRMDINNSLLFDEGTFDTLSSWDASTRLLLFEGERTDGNARTLEGEVFKVELKIEGTNVTDDQIVVGNVGVAIFDDVSAKTTLPKQEVRRILFPNPAKDWVNLRLGGEGTIRLVSANGETVSIKQVPDLSEFRLDLSQFPAGSYSVWMQDPKGSEVQRLLILD